MLNDLKGQNILYRDFVLSTTMHEASFFYQICLKNQYKIVTFLKQLMQVLSYSLRHN